MKIKSLLLATITMISLGSISFSETSQVKLPKMDPSIGQYAYFRDKLPEDAIAYIRIAHPVVQHFSAKNRSNDKALLQKESVNALQSFRAVLADEAKLTAQIKKLGLQFSEENLQKISAASAIFYHHLNGPIEGIILDKSRAFSLMAQGLISIPVNINSIEALNQLLADNPFAPSPLQFNAEGFAIDDMASFYFSPKAKRIIVLIGLEQNNHAKLQDRLASLKLQKNHEMYAYENQIDLTGQSTFAWIDLRHKGGILSAVELENPIAYAYLKEIDGFALGEGTNHDQQGQLKLAVKTNAEKLIGLDLQKQNDFNFKTAGAPLGAVIVPTPSLSMIKKMIESYVIASTPKYPPLSELEKTEVTESIYQSLLKEWEANAGFDLTEVLSFLGPNVTFYYDDLGIHTVVSLQDKKQFYRWLKKQDEMGILHYNHHKGIHHLSLQNPLLKFLQDKPLTTPDQAGLAMAYPFINEYIANTYKVRVLDANWHLYWSDEQDSIRISGLPQIVEEEDKFGKLRFDKWLTDKQGIDPKQVLFAATLDWKNADRNWYYNYLQFLQNSADILGTQFDVRKMPRADQLDFADSSRLGLQVTASDQFLTLSVDYGASESTGFIGSFFMPMMAAPFIGLIESFSLNDALIDDTSTEIDVEIEIDTEPMNIEKHDTDKAVKP